VIGSTVNAASRLEALTRSLGCSLVTSDDLVKRAKAELGAADVVFRPLMAQAPQPFRGLEHPIAIWNASARRGAMISCSAALSGVVTDRSGSELVTPLIDPYRPFAMSLRTGGVLQIADVGGTRQFVQEAAR
jgi:hypothetical protein